MEIIERTDVAGMVISKSGGCAASLKRVRVTCMVSSERANSSSTLGSRTRVGLCRTEQRREQAALARCPGRGRSPAVDAFFR